MKKLFGFMLTLALTLGVGTSALAAWTASGFGPAEAAAGDLLQGATPTVAGLTRAPTSSTAEVTLAWARSERATGYELRRLASVGGEVQAISSDCNLLIPNPAAGDPGCTETAAPEGRWRYAQRPRVGQHWVGNWSVAGAEVAIAPATPSEIVANRTSPDEISIDWTNNSTTADRSYLERSDDGGTSWTTVAEVPLPSTGHADGGLACEVQILYRVAAHSSTHELTGTVTDAVSASTGPCAVVTVRVTSIVDGGSTRSGQSSNWRPRVRVTVESSLGVPVAGAVVTGDFRWGDTESSADRPCTTGIDGTCVIETSGNANETPATFTVDGVSHALHPWGSGGVSSFDVVRP